MKLTALFESDARLRELERQIATGDLSAVMKLAQERLRTEDPRFEELIPSLRKIDNPDTKLMIQLWAEQNEIPTAEDFVLGLSKTREGISFAEASQKARDLKFWLVEEDEAGRGGYAVGVEIWESPAEGRVWMVWDSGYEEFDDESRTNFNYGIVDPKDHAQAQETDGILEHYRDYLY